MVRLFFIISFALIFNSCCPNKITSEKKDEWNKIIYGESPFLKNQNPPKQIKLNNFPQVEGYIFSKDYQPFWGKRFTPTKEEVEKAEKIFFEKINSKNLFKKIDFKKRFRQYIGNYEENKKVIEINFVKINPCCVNKSEYGFLIDKMYIRKSDHKNISKTFLFDRIVIED